MVNTAARALLLTLAGACALAACDREPERWAAPQRAEMTEPDAPARPPAAVPGAGPESPKAAAAALVGTWRVRLQSGSAEAKGVTYTFTADGRVTIGPAQTCRYRVEGLVLSIDCKGTTAESASGRLERQGADTLFWQVGDKTVRLEREAGLKEEP
jgi:hypothetical protein